MATTDEFVGKVLGDTVGLTNTVLAWIGDELGLWKDLASGGPARAPAWPEGLGSRKGPSGNGFTP